ncbi:hypothetical protein M3J09_012040 [Ascochyta lentis]
MQSRLRKAEVFIQPASQLGDSTTTPAEHGIYSALPAPASCNSSIAISQSTVHHCKSTECMGLAQSPTASKEQGTKKGPQLQKWCRHGLRASHRVLVRKGQRDIGAQSADGLEVLWSL